MGSVFREEIEVTGKSNAWPPGTNLVLIALAGDLSSAKGDSNLVLPRHFHCRTVYCEKADSA